MKCLRIIKEDELLGITDYAKPWYAARGVVMDEKNHIGMLYTKELDRYEIPGGEIDDNESVEQTFIREIKEEIGCDCEIIKELGYVELKLTKHNVEWISYFFLARLVGEKGIPCYTEEELTKTITIEWHTPKDAVRLVEHSKAESNSSIFLKESCLIALRECLKEPNENFAL